MARSLRSKKLFHIPGFFFETNRLTSADFLSLVPNNKLIILAATIVKVWEWTETAVIRAGFN